MKLERKHAVVLLVVAVWLVLTWARFIVALATTDGEPTGYYVAHSVLIVVNFVIAAVLGGWGLKALRAGSRSTSD
ncbi:hypothetical protein GCM10011519_19220 [Marmoricola endophyticus]|uniref:Uncharacterized protein n=1 Tax=Marmoricola endophyticus TaxID=2040280 RepID=A0A917BKG4_9ACTN|nr:hypothetical protein [Marmoricola endophyticus]GGF45472.1 hypothetical protein GCM10011519_19220 [Marmoricola endophyticus]